jgi:hypothetical protein
MTKCGASMGKRVAANCSSSRWARSASAWVIVLVIDHQPQRVFLARLRGFQVAERVVNGRVGDDAAQQRAFGQGKLGGGFGEVGPRRPFDAVSQVAKIHLVEIQREDFGLAVGVLQPDRQDAFAQFALHAAFQALLRFEQEVAGHLLGDGAAPGDHFAAAQVDPQRAGDADQVYTGVLVKIGVFGGDDRVDAVRRHVIQADGGVAPPSGGRISYRSWPLRS